MIRTLTQAIHRLAADPPGTAVIQLPWHECLGEYRQVVQADVLAYASGYGYHEGDVHVRYDGGRAQEYVIAGILAGRTRKLEPVVCVLVRRREALGPALACLTGGTEAGA